MSGSARISDRLPYFDLNNSLIRRESCGIRRVVLASEPDANLVANPRNVSTAVDEYGIHQALGSNGEAVGVDVLGLDEFH